MGRSSGYATVSGKSGLTLQHYTCGPGSFQDTGKSEGGLQGDSGGETSSKNAWALGQREVTAMHQDSPLAG